jgi:hypothetical protein
MMAWLKAQSELPEHLRAYLDEAKVRLAPPLPMLIYDLWWCMTCDVVTLRINGSARSLSPPSADSSGSPGVSCVDHATFSRRLRGWPFAPVSCG